MSFSGTLSPLGINALSALHSDVGFTINQTAKIQQGDWMPSGYTSGSLVSQTILASVSAKIKSVYTSVLATTILPASYRAMLTMGATVCPALANTRPNTFKPTYPGYGSWTGATLNSDNYPPKDYPVSTTYSYIQQAFGDYAWVTGWPGTNAWQKTTDTYKAATVDTPEYDEYFSDGFIATIARQAYYEMSGGQFNQTNNIASVFSRANNFKNQQNTKIASLVNSKTFMSGMFSNNNDLSTSDLAGVNQAFKVWGNDLIASGRAIDLRNISKFGLPSTLLRTLYRNRVITDPLKFCMLSNKLSSTEINDIQNPEYIPTITQEKKLYDSFLQITGNDLKSDYNGILYGLNCKTVGIESLADLLDPKKLFPNSYPSLTVPRYSTTTDSAKIYDFIYSDGGVNNRIDAYGDYLVGILPDNLVLSCGAFATTMSHVKNVANMDIQKFGQVVANLELPNLNLPLIDIGGGIPVDVVSVDRSLSKIALGSGNSNSYKQCDFFGAASGYPYTNYYQIAQRLLTSLPLTNLQSLYDTMPVTTDAEVLAFVAAVNTEISNIYTNNKTQCDELNYYWDLIGTQLATEQRAIPMCISDSDSIQINEDPGNIDSFVDSIEQYALDNSDGQSAPTLEAISDITILGGQSIVAMMREARNAQRLGNAGGELQNSISPMIDTCAASATVTLSSSGTISSVTVTNASRGYTPADPPILTVYPVGRGAKLSAVLAQDGSISSITVIDGGSGYDHAQIEISPPPQCQYQNPPQQTYADTSESQLVAPELVAPTTASPTVSQAITDVTTCNCDCWN